MMELTRCKHTLPLAQSCCPDKTLGIEHLLLALVDLGLLLQDSESHTLALGQRDKWGVLVANDKDVGLSSDKGVASSIL